MNYNRENLFSKFSVQFFCIKSPRYLHLHLDAVTNDDHLACNLARSDISYQWYPRRHSIQLSLPRFKLLRAPPENWIGKFVWLSRWENWKCSMMFLHAKGTIHDVTRSLSWYCQFPRQFFLAVKRPSWLVKLRLSAFNQMKFHLPFVSRSMQFDLTFTLSWRRDFLDCLTFKIDDIILFEQRKHLYN